MGFLVFNEISPQTHGLNVLGHLQLDYYFASLQNTLFLLCLADTANYMGAAQFDRARFDRLGHHRSGYLECSVLFELAAVGSSDALPGGVLDDLARQQLLKQVKIHFTNLI